MACSWGAEEPGIQGSTEWADVRKKIPFLLLQINLLCKANHDRFAVKLS